MLFFSMPVGICRKSNGTTPGILVCFFAFSIILHIYKKILLVISFRYHKYTRPLITSTNVFSHFAGDTCSNLGPMLY